MQEDPWHAASTIVLTEAIPILVGRLKAILLYRMTRSRDQSQKHTTELSSLMRPTVRRLCPKEWPPVEIKECGIVSQEPRDFILPSPSIFFTLSIFFYFSFFIISSSHPPFLKNFSQYGLYRRERVKKKKKKI